MENSTIINGTQFIKDNMPIQPESIITILAIFFFIAIMVGLGIWLWIKIK